jgi:periplasmic protein TonB
MLGFYGIRIVLIRVRVLLSNLLSTDPAVSSPRSAVLSPLPRSAAHPSGGELSPALRRQVVAGILALHGLGLWGLLQLNAVRDAVQQAGPIFVSLIAPATPDPAPRPTQAAAKPRPLAPRSQPVPTVPVLAAEPQATPAPSAPAAAALPAPSDIADTPAPATAAEAVAQAPAPRQIPDSAVQFLQLPAVVYPRASQRLGEHGLVIVRALVGSNGGAPHTVQIERSSGHPRLDHAALAAVLHARFKPYAESGRPVEGWALVPIRFELEK